MIEIRNSSLFINSVLIEGVRVGVSVYKTGEARSFIINTDSYEISLQIGSHSLSEMPPMSRMTLQYKIDWSNIVNSQLKFADLGDKEHSSVTFTFGTERLPNWQREYTFSQYALEFASTIEAADEIMVEYRLFREDPWMKEEAEDSQLIRGFSVKFPIFSRQSSLTNIINRCSSILRDLNNDVERSCASRVARDYVAISFDFPEEVRVPCEQYLLYFSQFLRDLGVEAGTTLTHEAGQVLFTVTPNDKQQALDKIRTALEVYLHLPSNPISDTTTADIAIQKLEINVLRLRTDLKLAAAELQAKNATIQAQQLMIEIQKALLSGEIIFDSLKDVTPKPEDKENLLGGVLALTTYKDKGIEVNLAELYRKLRRLFKDKDDKQ
jgi:hypothetical protein